MKVTFTCTKCGATLASGDTVSERLPDIEMRAATSACLCTKLTYGPLTEELVAEALYLACVGHAPAGPPGADFGREARFVLRLLEQRDRSWGPYLRYTEQGAWRDWLLDLARKP